MSYKSVMVIKAAVCLVFGIILVSIPGALVSFLGATLSPGGAFTSREYAAALFGNLMLTWFARNAADSDARRAIILALFVYDAIGFVVSLLTVLSGILNPLGWFVVAIYLFFTLAFGYLLTTKVSVR
ncbi:MAG: hypothetical protein V1784_05380 [bacterium]